MTKKTIKQLVAVVTRGNANYWTRIGVAYENKDGSFNLRFDYLPTDPLTTIQLRDFQKAGEDATADAAAGGGNGEAEAF